MTQPAEAVGGEATPAEPNAQDYFTQLAEEQFGVSDQEEPAEEVEEEAPEQGVESETDEEAEISEEDDEEELPPIDPPNSLTAEEKESFKAWPRDAQEAITRRIGDLEKGFQSKAQEAAQAQRAAQAEALKVVEQVKAATAEHLQRYAQQFEMNVQEPDIALAMSDNPADRALYIQQDRAYKHMLAQRDQAQRDAQQARAEQETIQQKQAELAAQEFQERLASELPELLDPATGQQLAKELNATAELLGFDPNEISDVSAIKALKVTSEWKTKADKYDALQKRKMERVRAGKSPPPISKPGTARTPDANRSARASAAFEAAKSTKNAQARGAAFFDYLTNTGQI